MTAVDLFGPLIGRDGVTFRLWAPQAKSVTLITDRQQVMRRSNEGWFTFTSEQARSGTQYKFRIDDEIDVPDPASRFQPDDVHGPSEVIDQAYDWQARVGTAGRGTNAFSWSCMSAPSRRAAPFAA